MEKLKKNFKNIVIVLLTIFLCVSFFNRNEDMSDDINKLHEENIVLLHEIEDLKKDIEDRQKTILNSKSIINDLLLEQEELNKIIENLNNRKDETTNYVNNLDDDGIISEFSEYIKRRKQ